MIGDTLFDCGESLDHYLVNYQWPDEVKARVRRLREDIREVQQWLDAGPFENVGNVRPIRPAKMVSRSVVETRVRQVLLRHGEVLQLDEPFDDYFTRDAVHHLIQRERLTLEDLAHECQVMRPGEVIEE